MEGHIFQSKILAQVRQLSSVDLLTLKNAVADDIQGTVDLGCFFIGASLNVDLISTQSDAGTWQFFESFIPALRVDGSVDVSADMFVAVGGDMASHIMLADFREAMQVASQSGFFCYRAIEAAMQSFKADPSQKDGPAWEAMRLNLRVAKSAIDKVKDHADWARHGQPGFLDGTGRLVVLKTTRAIISRYLDFLVSGRKPLAPAKYPELS